MIIDVREPFEYKRGHIKGAINIPLTKLLTDSSSLNDVPEDASLILYCRTGSRSGLAVNYLRAKGYTNLVNGINQEHVTKLIQS